MTAPQVSRLAPLTRRGCLASTALLIALVLAGVWRSGMTNASFVGAFFLVTPLLLPVRGMLLDRRRTYAWATLCVIPCFVYGLTETIANPAARPTAAVILFVSLTLFVMLIAHLRVTRPVVRDQAVPGG